MVETASDLAIFALMTEGRGLSLDEFCSPWISLMKHSEVEDWLLIYIIQI